MGSVVRSAYGIFLVSLCAWFLAPRVQAGVVKNLEEQMLLREKSQLYLRSGSTADTFSIDHPTSLRTRFVEFHYAAFLCEMHRVLVSRASSNSVRAPYLKSLTSGTAPARSYSDCLERAKQVFTINDSNKIKEIHIAPYVMEFEAYLKEEKVRCVVVGSCTSLAHPSLLILYNKTYGK